MNTNKKIKENYKYLCEINKEYEELAGNIVIYLRVELNRGDAEEAISDVLGILLSAQERREDLKEVVGDYKEFCIEIIKAYKDGDKYYTLKGYLDNLIIFIIMMPFFIGLDMIVSYVKLKYSSIHEFFSGSYSMSLGPVVSLIFALIVANVIVKYIGKNTEKESKKQMIIIILVYILNVALMVIASAIAGKYTIYTFNNIPIFIFDIVILVVILYVFNLIWMSISSSKAEKKRRMNM